LIKLDDGEHMKRRDMEPKLGVKKERCKINTSRRLGRGGDHDLET
jgi:hypothetical protein